jgi:hypothetical protein
MEGNAEESMPALISGVRPMRRPVTRVLLALSCSVCLFTASGCSLFRSEVADTFIATPARHLPDISESAATDAPPADPLPVNSVPASLASTTPVPLESTAAAFASTAPQEEPAESSCYVEIRALRGEPKRIRMSLEDATYVQKVLEETGLIKEFRDMSIELSRKLEDGGRHKLEIRYDRKQKRVVSAFDYSLHPNDLLVVREESHTAIDELLKKLAGPLAR